MFTDYKLRIRFLEPILGSMPKDPGVYATWVALQEARRDDEEAPEFTDSKGWTGFAIDEKGLHLYDYQIKGWFKEAAATNPKITGFAKKDGGMYAGAAIKSRLDRMLFIAPRRVYFGKTAPDGVVERPLRAKTMQGDRVTLVRSDAINAGTEIEFTIKLLTDAKFPVTFLPDLLPYGELFGLCQFRTGGYGRFEVVSLVKV